MHFDTLAVHGGQEPDPAFGAVMTPIYQTSTFAQHRIGEAKYDYARTANPTRTALQRAIAALEHAKHGLAFASGMAAIDTVLRLLKPGDHLVASNDVYGGTYRIFKRVYEDYGVRATFVEMGDLSAVRAALEPRTRLIWVETPTNPLLKLADIAALAELLRSQPLPRPLLVVDNTFASPFIQQPLRLGADIVVHSATKYLGGHSDVVNGLIALNDDELHARLKFLQNAVGAVPGPLDCFLVLRGIKTLHLRMARHCASALRIATWLESHPAVARVYYPGLPSHPQHELARRQMHGFGGMIAFLAKGGAEAARRIAESTRLFTLAESLGGVESLIEVPAAMTHLSVAQSPLAVDPALVRLSVGVEDPEDLIADLDQALRGS